MTSSNNPVVPQAREALDKFKMEAAREVGVNLKQGYNGDLTSREAGSVGGQMVKKMIEAYENSMKYACLPIFHQIFSDAVPAARNRIFHSNGPSELPQSSIAIRFGAEAPEGGKNECARTPTWLTSSGTGSAVSSEMPQSSASTRCAPAFFAREIFLHPVRRATCTSPGERNNSFVPPCAIGRPASITSSSPHRRYASSRLCVTNTASFP